MGRLDGRVAIVTGAAHGARAALGSVYALALAQEGARVTVADTKDCGSVAKQIEAAGGIALPLMVDVRDEKSVADMVARTVAEFDKLDILVNNAAIGSNIPPIPITEMSVAQWDDLMAVNVRGPFLCSKEAVPVMRRQNYGKIINVGSTTMVSGLPNRLHYVTAKGAILAMTRAMARELGAYGIRVNTISYGLITNPVVENDWKEHPEQREAMLKSRSLPSEVLPADLIGTLVYLASRDSDSMTGQCVVIDAGQIYN